MCWIIQIVRLSQLKKMPFFVVAFLKVRLQIQNVDKPLYRGTFHCFQSIIRQESVRPPFSVLCVLCLSIAGTGLKVSLVYLFPIRSGVTQGQNGRGHSWVKASRRLHTHKGAHRQQYQLTKMDKTLTVYHYRGYWPMKKESNIRRWLSSQWKKSTLAKGICSFCVPLILLGL